MKWTQCTLNEGKKEKDSGKEIIFEDKKKNQCLFRAVAVGYEK